MKVYIYILSLFFGQLLKAQTSLNISVVNEEVINTAEHEFSPTKWKNQFIYVSSFPSQGKNFDKKSKTSFFNLKFTAASYNGNLLKSANFPDLINSNYHEGPASFHESSNTLYFTRTDLNNGRKNADQNGKVKLQIYTSVNEDGVWTKPQKLQIEQKNASYCHPSISEDGKTLFFASDQREENKMDIYYCLKKDERWSAPILIENINTGKNDWFPFVHPKGYLFFASDGRTEDQGLDIYISKIGKDSFSIPQLLPFPINSNFDDFGIHLSLDGKTGYFSSNRPNGLGKDDIYSFSCNQDIIRFLLKLQEGTTTEVLSKEEVNTVKKPVTNPQPSTILETNTASNETTQNTTNFSSRISHELGAVSTFENIYFDFDNENIDPSSANSLDELCILMHNVENLKIQISAHTDSRGKESYNQELSDKRANATKKYLISKGIDPNRIIALGFGESRLKNRCVDGVICTESEHKQNRRIEVKVIDN